jgi:HEPN domain-containing protein
VAAARRSSTEKIAFWWDIGIHNYIAARTAAEWGYWNVAGRNAHFGVELMLKYLLVVPRLWDRQWPNRGKPAIPAELHTHNLMVLWRRLNRDYPQHPLAEFADLVRELNRWEDIRYAQYLDAGATVFDPSMEDIAIARAKPDEVEVYVLDIPELDRFFRALMDFAGITTRLRGNRMWFGKGWDFYARNNPHAIA